nr:T9SS type A sorting domain-containing protein [Saprospiraceae bacterium]
DTLSPSFVYVPNDTTVDFTYVAELNNAPQNTMLLNQLLGEANAWDFCGLDTIVQTVDVEKNNCGFLRKITRLFWATDNAGNLTHATQTIHVKLPPYTINLPSDHLPGDPGDPAELTVVEEQGSSLVVIFDDFETPSQCDTLPVAIRRVWTVGNICEGNITQFPVTLPRLDLNADNLNGDAYTTLVDTDSVYLQNNNTLSALISSNATFWYEQHIRYSYEDTVSNSVTGTVFHDIDGNCGKNGNEPGLANWPVKAIGNTTGQVYSTTTMPNGVYQINDICASDTELELSLDVPFNYGQNCQTTWTVQTIPNTTVVQHIPVQLNNECALMEVNLAAPFLRRCFPNTYMVSYCNYSSQTIEDAYVEVQLDSFMEFLASSLPEILLGDNRYSFELGDLAPGECGSFPVAFMLSCEAVLGQTHCSEAHIYPDTLCPISSDWSGANIEVSGECINDEILLRIKNTGNGDMTAPLDFIVVEDVIMYMQGNFNLGAGQTYEVPAFAANGATWRLEAEQVPEHPYPGSVAVALEGCDGINELGLVNLFPLENPNPFIAVDCQENIGAFDPNDKQAQPKGYGEEHFIHRNTDIEYTIRFQNTGTDTAFTVVILDQLSEHLDPTSIRPGASSHAYSFELIGGDSLRFTFSNIMLPDSNVNLAASQGFVQFVAKQMPDLALGSVIANEAAIYFDFNDPITTNRVFHTIGEDFIQVLNSASETANVHGQPTVYPNPAFGAVTFALPLELKDASYFTLHDQLGKLVHRQAVSGDKFVFERKGMAPGIYFYSIENEGLKIFAGKVVLK